MKRESCTVEVDEHVFIVTINRPEQLNALNKSAHYELGEVFNEFERNPNYWIGIITGAGRAFCAGADLKSEEPLDHTFVPSTGFAGLTHRFERTKPIIAAVNGLALGGGFETALACDIIVAAQDARFGLTEARVGLYAAAGGIQRLIQEIGLKRANALLLTGRQISAEEAEFLGLVNEVTPPNAALDAARTWADEILKCSPTAVGATKAIARQMVVQTETSMKSMMHLPAVKAIAGSPDFVEGSRAFAERRPPRWSNPEGA